MKKRSTKRHYRPTESKYKGGAEEMYVTYDLKQQTRGGNTAMYPKVKRVYVAGDICDWQVGVFEKRTGKKVRGVRIDYRQTREGFHKKPYLAHRGQIKFRVSSTDVEPTNSTFSHIVEVPPQAKNVRFITGKLRSKYSTALQRVS